MSGERRNGNLLVRLGPHQQAYPEELIRQRRTREGQTEYLIRWRVTRVDDGSNTDEPDGDGSGSSGVGCSVGSSSIDNKTRNILMWMSANDVYANIPTLPGKRPLPVEKARPSGPFHSNVTFSEDELFDMREDVKKLVQRARKLMAKNSDFAISLSHTIHVLSAYASIGSLGGVFKETGALDLLMELLCNKERQTRRSAGKMLRALASHDAGSRAYVLLSLSQQDGIKQHMEFDHRCTLLKLFAETTSSEEHANSFENICLPQIPGKLLFTLVKSYLCATSLMDKLSTNEVALSSEQQEPNPSSSSSSYSSSSFVGHLSGQLRLQLEFKFAMAMANLISELVSMMLRNLNRESTVFYPASAKEEMEEGFNRIARRSIFQPQFSVPEKTENGFKTLTDFTKRAPYVKYVQDNLKIGMQVRMLREFKELSPGDEGEFHYVNDGSPPVQVYWKSISRTMGVCWHMVEIIGSGSSGQTEKETQEKVSSHAETPKLTAVSQTFISKPPSGMYYMPYLMEGLQDETGTLSRAEWWEVLFFIEKLEPKQQQEVNNILHQTLYKQIVELDDATLIQLSVSSEVVRKILRYLKQTLEASSLEDLLCCQTFAKHYLQRGGASLEDEEMLTNTSLSSSWIGGEEDFCSFPSSAAPTASASSASSSSMCSEVSEDMEEKMKVLNKVQDKRTVLEKFGEVVDIMKKSSCDAGQQLAGMKFLCKLLEEEGPQERSSLRSYSAQTISNKVLKMLVDMIGSQLKQNAIIALLLTRSLLLKYDWRVSFATRGGVKGMLSCMQEFPTCTNIQQIALATLEVITGASKHNLHSAGSCLPLSEYGTQMMLEIFANIDSATSEGSKRLLGAIPSAIDLMLGTPGCALSVRNGLLIVIMLISSHKSLAEQLMACNITSVLKKCLSSHRSESMLATTALHHIFMVHKLQNTEFKEEFDFKATELKMVVVDLQEMKTTKEVILTLEKLLCDNSSQLEEERNEVMRSRDTFQNLVRLMGEHQVDCAVQLPILRILNKFLDNYQEDLLPWHESIEPCLSSMMACINDRETVQQFIHFLHRLASINKDYALVMCHLGAKEALNNNINNLLMVTELRDLIKDSEKYTNICKITTSILAGCIQMVFSQIEEHRRSHQPINIPFFDVFLRCLCQGSSMALKEDKCWEKVEVSSNHYQAYRLTDKNPKTYWESTDHTLPHFINISMQTGIIIRQLAVLVTFEDRQYMPACVVVLGGDDPTHIETELNTVNVPQHASRVVLLENMTRFWSIIQIRIKSCHITGCDTRVHGFDVLGLKPTLRTIFKEQLCCHTYLFYATKARTWCQEIQRDKSQLLHLFNKLNSALHHEQMFAARFLPDSEVAEALGRTCWEALITPIVQSITVSETPAVSPLSWLFNEFLETSELSKRDKSVAASVCRLTHLLVHADNTQVDTEELKPLIKFNGEEETNKKASAVTSSSATAKSKVKNTSSIASIALCWQGVVQFHVKKSLDVTNNLPDFVERYRNMYLHLKNGMEELFGLSTAFVLALQQGFSAALLQLSVLTAMRVSEQFARYIDQMVQENRGNSGDVESLKKLQQLMESILFLSGLELANTFEHFYRYYLGERLLSQGKVWLENAVIKQIGTCFPNQFPQQMLRNLHESEKLQREFHLYRLQQLDKSLQDEDGWMDEEIIDEQVSEPEDESEVKVLVLSPECWAVSTACYLEEPRKYFPQQLYTYLAEFKDFYSNSQSMYSVSKPRRVQWTWLGHAELRYGSCTLYVSTLQMYILLQFNQQEIINVEALLQTTGLSPNVLTQALKPLIKKEILTHKENRQGPVKDDHITGVLSLNEKWVAQSSERESYCYLLPKQTYLNVNKDIFMYIMQIMMNDKEIHIDNLVFKVLDTCQKKEASYSSCTITDIHSCIMHVIDRGYIHRKKEKPNIVEFLTEKPSTPQKGQAYTRCSDDHKP